MKDFMEAMEVDVDVAGTGPAGLATAYYLAKERVKVVVFERQLRIGRGMLLSGKKAARVAIKLLKES
jgi:ribulose 1,5-bisphosphate synthetase/thiazole synthase